jgi:hypothetical protein
MNGFARHSYDFKPCINEFGPHALNLGPDANHFEPAPFISGSEITLLDLPEHGLDAKENGLRSPPIDFGSEEYGLGLRASKNSR